MQVQTAPWKRVQTISRADSGLRSPDSTALIVLTDVMEFALRNLGQQNVETLRRPDSRCSGVLQTVGHKACLRGFCTLQFISSLTVVPFSCLAGYCLSQICLIRARGRSICFLSDGLHFVLSTNQVIFQCCLEYNIMNPVSTTGHVRCSYRGQEWFCSTPVARR